MEMYVNVISISDEALKELHKENDYGSCKFESKEIFKHGGGFFTDTVIFREDDKYFRFLAVSYLDNHMTFTNPHEVFKKELVHTRNIYTYLVED